MNFSLNIFDVFAAAIPGSLYLAATIYLSIRFGWVDWDDLAGLSTTFALIGAVVASFVLGQVLAPSLRHLVSRIPLGQRDMDELRAEFSRRNPTLAGRPFLQADPHTLLAGLRQVSPEAATEVDRSRAAGIMLRNLCPAFLIGAAIAVVEAFVQWEAAPIAVGGGLIGLSVLALREGQIRGRWAVSHTYECATWIPDVDARVGPPAQP